MKKAKQTFLSILSVLLMTAFIFSMTACTKAEKQEDLTKSVAAEQLEAEQTEEATVEAQTTEADDTLSEPIGEGAHTFLFTVENSDGSKINYTVSTDETTVGDALFQLGLIDGEQGPYGLYVKSVNGVTADYDTDGAYWAFYIDGEMAMTGVDGAAVEDGHSYAFVWTAA